MESATISAKEAAQFIGVSYWLLLEMVKRGDLRPIRAGRKYLFRRETLDAWMNRQDLYVG